MHGFEVIANTFLVPTDECGKNFAATARTLTCPKAATIVKEYECALA